VIKPTELQYLVEDQIFASFGKGGWIRVVLRTIKHEKFDGAWQTYKFPWVVLERGDSVAILIHDSVRDEVILVEQFRPAILKSIFEIVAGTLKPGEKILDCVRREVWEEVGLKVENIRYITTFYPSPGATSERIMLYHAMVNSLGENGLVNGLKSEGECIKKHVVTVNEALGMIDAHIIEDAKTIIALQNFEDEE